MSGADVSGLISAINSSKDGNIFGGEGFAGIIMLLIIAGIFSGGLGWGTNSAVASGLTRAEMDSEFLQRDIFNTNTNVLENKYASAVGMSGLSKDILENRYSSELCCFTS